MKKIVSLYQKYERRMMTFAFLAGFVWDNLTLQRIDLLYENVVLVVYLVLAAGSITVRSVYLSGRMNNVLFARLSKYTPFIMQFAMGGLFSGFFIFYSRSGSIFASWPFVFFLLSLIVINERLSDRYRRLVFQMSVFFIALFSYMIFLLPVLTGYMGAWMFVLASFLSIILIGVFVRLLLRLSPERMMSGRHQIRGSIAIITICFYVLYFTNIIPPIPLTLKEIGIYHNVVRFDQGVYEITYEKPPWYIPWREFNEVVHVTAGEPIYGYSAVFAPTKIETVIFHRWSIYDRVGDRWIATGQIPFPIRGGRDGGYRGFTIKSSVPEGEWRLEVITERGQIIGRTRFSVETVSDPPLLSMKNR